MRLLFIHGAPAVGKLSVAKAVIQIANGRLFDNHAAIDVARTVFDFGAPGFWELVNSTRISVLEAAAEHDVPLVVMTACYSEPEDQDLFQRYTDVLADYAADILPVYLYCAEDEMLRRVGNSDRKERKKISSKTGLRNFLMKYNLVPVPHENCIQIDSEKSPPEKIARKIVDHFHIS